MGELSFWLAQVCGFFVLLACAVTPQFKTKSGIILACVVANVFAAVQFYLLGQMLGTISVSLAIMRGIVFLIFERQRGSGNTPISCVVFFVVAQIVCVFVFWDGWLNLLLFVPALYTYGQWQKDIRVTRGTLLVTSIATGVYCIFVSAYMGALNEVIQSISILIAFWRYRGKVAKFSD